MENYCALNGIIFQSVMKKTFKKNSTTMHEEREVSPLQTFECKKSLIIDISK